jgi:hypothetical protein
MNLYRYCGDDPVDRGDPLGLDPTRDFIAGVGDLVTFGQGWKVAEAIFPGYRETVDTDSGAYRAGTVAGLGLGMVDGAGEARLVRAALTGEKLLPRIVANPKIYAQLEKQLAKDGPASITKALGSAEKTLAEHQAKLAQIVKEGGHTSQVESTIKNVERQIETLEKFQKDKGL